MLTRIEIDLNVRVRGRGTFAGYEDVQTQNNLTRTRLTHANAPVAIGEHVIAWCDDIETDATVVDIWDEKQIVYLAVDWHGFRDITGDDESGLKHARPTTAAEETEDEKW